MSGETNDKSPTVLPVVTTPSLVIATELHGAMLRSPFHIPYTSMEAVRSPLYLFQRRSLPVPRSTMTPFRRERMFPLASPHSNFTHANGSTTADGGVHRQNLIGFHAIPSG